MSLALVATPQRITLRWQARMLILWAGITGLACSVLLLHRYAVHAMAIRYAACAAAMYFFGWVLGAYACLRWWGGKSPSDTHFPEAASPGDVTAYRQQVIDRREHWFSISRWWNLGQDDDNDEGPRRSLLEAFFVWIFQLVVGLVLSIVATLVGLVFGYLPILVAEALAGFLALLVVTFVIGSRAMAHESPAPVLSGYLTFTLRKTGLAGLACIAAAGVVGHWLDVSYPEATDLLDVILPSNFLASLAELPVYLPSFLAGFLR